MFKDIEKERMFAKLLANHTLFLPVPILQTIYPQPICFNQKPSHLSEQAGKIKLFSPAIFHYEYI
jgi:hypothetical protein